MASREVIVTVHYCDSRLGDLLCNLPEGHLDYSEPHRDGGARWIGSTILLD